MTNNSKQNSANKGNNQKSQSQEAKSNSSSKSPESVKATTDTKSSPSQPDTSGVLPKSTADNMKGTEKKGMDAKSTGSKSIDTKNTNTKSTDPKSASMAKKEDSKSSAPGSQSTTNKRAEPAKASKEQTQKPMNNTPSHNTNTTDNTKGKSGSSKTAIALAIIGILLAGGSAFYAFQQTQEKQASIVALQSELGTLKQQVADTTAQAKVDAQQASEKGQALINQAETKIEQQDNSIQSLQEALSQVNGRRPNDWLLAEADYLVKMAGRKLTLEHDITSAIQLMQTADQRVASLNSPSLITLRQAIATDITALKTLPTIDHEGIAISLIALQKQVDNLPLASTLFPEEEVLAEQKAEVTGNIGDWKENLTTSMTNFMDHFINVRVIDGEMTPPLPPVQRYYIKENIKAKIENSINGVFEENDALYQAGLSTAKAWTGTYFDKDSAKVQKFTQQLDEFAKQKIAIKYPAKFVSQQPLTDVLASRLNKAVSSLNNSANKEK